jgi:hypothetical protein
VNKVARLFDAPWSRNPKLGLALILASSALTIIIGFAGPSTVALTLGERNNLLPPWYLPYSLANWSQWICAPTLWIGISLGAIGLWICIRSLQNGWLPRPWRLFALGATLSTGTALVLPMTSGDVLMYASYGRLQVLGLNPYNITPAQLRRHEFDPVLRWTEQPWPDTPSVYGPIASWSQWLAAFLGGDNMHDIVFWLQMMALIPFIIIGAIALALTRQDQAAQARAALLTVLNPLMIWSVIAGAHNEALTLVFAITALLFIRRHPFLAGICIGLAGTVKVSLVFYGLAMLWAYRGDWRRIILLGLGALIPLGLAYGLWAREALLAAQRNTGYISGGSWAPPMRFGLTLILGDGNARAIIGVLGWIGLVGVAFLLSKALPWQAVPGLAQGIRPQDDPLTVTARTAVILTAGWLLTSPYTLSWYDLIIWVPLGILGTSKLDSLLIWRGALLSVAYVTARSVQFSQEMEYVTFFLRDVLCSWGQILVLAALAIWCWREWADNSSWSLRSNVRNLLLRLRKSRDGVKR